MGKKVVTILAGREGGNTECAAEIFVKAATAEGAQVKTFRLRDLQYGGCTGCMACKNGKSEVCVIEDDLAEVLEEIAKCDIVVFASPVYIGDVCGQLKLLIDRMYSYMGPDYREYAPDFVTYRPGIKVDQRASRLEPGKQIVFISLHGLKQKDAFADIFNRYEPFWNWFGFSRAHFLRSGSVGAKGLFTEEHPMANELKILAKQICG